MSKLALITGAALRLGKAMALHLADSGYDLAIHYNSSLAPAKDLQKQIEAKGRKAMILGANLSDMEAVMDIIPRVNDKLGHVSLLINNASYFNSAGFAETDQATFNQDMGVNFAAPFFLTQAFAKQDKTSTGDMVINMTDSFHQALTSKYFLYRIAKQSLHHFTMMAAKDLAPKIRVNAIAPGPALPPPEKDDKHFAKVVQTTPLQIPSPPDTITAGLDYLLAAKSITGQVLYIASGMQLQQT